MTITGLTTRLSRIRKNLQTKLEKYWGDFFEKVK
jgi:hypothetical protein